MHQPGPPPVFYPPPNSLDIGQCFRDAWDVFTRNFVVLTVAGLLFEVLSIATLTIFMGPLCGGMAFLSLRALRRTDKMVELGDLFALFPRRFGGLVGMACLLLFATLTATLCCLVPGIVLGVLWMFPYQFVADKNLGVFDALSASWRLVQERGFWPNLGLWLLIMLPSLFLGSAPVIGPFLGWMMIPLFTLVASAAYLQQSGHGDAAIG